MHIVTHVLYKMLKKKFHVGNNFLFTSIFLLEEFKFKNESKYIICLILKMSIYSFICFKYIAFIDITIQK